MGVLKINSLKKKPLMIILKAFFGISNQKGFDPLSLEVSSPVAWGFSRVLGSLSSKACGAQDAKIKVSASKGKISFSVFIVFTF